MKRTKLHALNPESARKRLKAAKSNETFMTALMERDHPEHKEAVGQWTRLHEVAFQEPNDQPSPSDHDRAIRTQPGVVWGGACRPQVAAAEQRTNRDGQSRERFGATNWQRCAEIRFQEDQVSEAAGRRFETGRRANGVGYSGFPIRSGLRMWISGP